MSKNVVRLFDAKPAPEEVDPDGKGGGSFRNIPDANLDYRPPTPRPARVQIRMELHSLDKAERDLVILQSALSDALRLVRSARRTGNRAALGGVRHAFEDANRMLNARWRDKDEMVLPEIVE